MFEQLQRIDSLTKFKRETPAVLDQLRQTGEPLVLTINGKPALVVQDIASYQRLLSLVDRLEAIEGIQRGLDDIEQGRMRPIGELLAEKKKKYGL